MYPRLSRVTFATVTLALVLGAAQSAAAQGIAVKEPWIRGTVPGQTATGAFMEITSKAPARLVAVASPVAKAVEIHNMTMEGGVMKMFAVNGVDLPANKTVKFGPGGYHVMLLDLKHTLKAGERVPLKLTFELPDRKKESVELSVEVREVTGERKHGH